MRAAYEADRAEARSAAGRAGAMQGNTDGLERYTAPSLVLESQDRRLEAVGFQPVEAYDVLLANLDPSLERRDPADAILAHGNDASDRTVAEHDLLGLVADGRARRVQLGDDALWYPAG